MSTGQLLAASQQAHSGALAAGAWSGGAARRGALTTWAPFIVAATVLYIAQHDARYASLDANESEAGADLAAEMGASRGARQLGFLTLGALGAFGLVRPAPIQTAVNRPLAALLASIAGWMLLSATWADDVVLSLKRSIPQLLTLLGAVGVAKHWQPRDVCAFTVRLTVLYLALGIAAECSSGAFLRGSDYRFSGTLHPNDQAINCALLCVAALCLCGDARLESHGIGRLMWLAPLFIGGAFLLLTGSRSGVLGAVAAVTTMLMMGASLLRKAVIVGALYVAALFAAILWVESDDASNEFLVSAAAMGRNQDADEMASLTGRVPIWFSLSGAIAERPLFGYGYGGFWTQKRVEYYSSIHGWAFAHAHSAYLETILNLGVVGLALGLTAVCLARRSGIRAYAAALDPGYRFAAAVLTMSVVHGLLDSSFVREGLASAVALLCVAILVFHGRGEQCP